MPATRKRGPAPDADEIFEKEAKTIRNDHKFSDESVSFAKGLFSGKKHKELKQTTARKERPAPGTWVSRPKKTGKANKEKYSNEDIFTNPTLRNLDTPYKIDGWILARAIKHKSTQPKSYERNGGTDSGFLAVRDNMRALLDAHKKALSNRRPDDIAEYRKLIEEIDQTYKGDRRSQVHLHTIPLSFLRSDDQVETAAETLIRERAFDNISDTG